MIDVPLNLQSLFNGAFIKACIPYVFIMATLGPSGKTGIKLELLDSSRGCSPWGREQVDTDCDEYASLKLKIYSV